MAPVSRSNFFQNHLILPRRITPHSTANSWPYMNQSNTSVIFLTDVRFPFSLTINILSICPHSIIHLQDNYAKPHSFQNLILQLPTCQEKIILSQIFSPAITFPRSPDPTPFPILNCQNNFPRQMTWHYSRTLHRHFAVTLLTTQSQATPALFCPFTSDALLLIHFIPYTTQAFMPLINCYTRVSFGLTCVKMLNAGLWNAHNAKPIRFHAIQNLP